MKKINLGTFIQKTGERMAMTDTEHARMKQVLVEYMAMKPMRNVPLERRRPLAHAWLSFYAFSRKTVALSLIGVLLLSGAGASYAAESALPGDALYTLKVQVNEPLVAALSVSSEAKAEWNTKRAERRLEEAAKLASEARLDAETEATLRAQFETHADAAVAAVSALEEKDSSAAFAIASRFETRLAAHDVILADAGHEVEGQSVRDEIRTKALAFTQIRERVEGVSPAPDAALAVSMDVGPSEVSLMMATAPVSEGAEEPAAAKTSAAMDSARAAVGAGAPTTIDVHVVERMAKSAKKSLAETERLFKNVSKKLEASTQARISAQLDYMDEALDSGNQSFRAGEHTVAFHSYQEVLNGSEQLQVYLKAFSKLRISRIPDVGGLSARFEERVEGSLQIRSESAESAAASSTVESQKTEPSHSSGATPVSEEKKEEVPDDIEIDTETRDIEVRIGL